MLGNIKKEFLQARKDKDATKANILRVLLGEIESDQKRGFVVNDADVIARIKKIIQSNCDCLESTFSEDNAKLLSDENKILEAFLPKQMTGSEIRTAIEESGATNIGQAMGYLKKNHAGLYDGKTASKVAKEVL